MKEEYVKVFEVTSVVGNLGPFLSKEHAEYVSKCLSALKSIADSSCCASCQEARLVARTALGIKEQTA